MIAANIKYTIVVRIYEKKKKNEDKDIFLL
jgi:hypothetical protein